MHRSEEAFKYLLSRVGYNKEPLRSRSFAVQGLANSTEWQTDLLKKQALEELGKSLIQMIIEDKLTDAFLEKLIRDPNQLVRVEAVEALVQLKVKSCSISVEATRCMYSHDDHSWLNRKLRQLQASETDNQQAAHKQAIEKLQNRIKILEEKFSIQEELAKTK